ncbi:hypothetical protein FRB96_005962 [Tulasnella sp. 330]|nr:hypothetical protein FRB96_005962 [Tulasnella sp. 330]
MAHLRVRFVTTVLIILLSSAILFSNTRFALTWRPVSTPPPKDTAVSQSGTPTSSHKDSHRVSWEDRQIPQTTLSAHVTGWSVFENLYMINGSFHIVSDDVAAFPPIRRMISAGYKMANGDAETARQEPTPRDMVVISTREASRLFGQSASRMKGVSFVTKDPPQFIGHYYHFTAEVFFGLWRTYSSLDPLITATGETSLPEPSRLIMPHCPYGDDWRDEAGLNHIVLRAGIPSLAFEYMEDWQERASTNQPYIMDRVVLTARTTVHRAKDMALDDKISAVAARLPGSANWWMPIRNNVVEFAGGGELPAPNVRPVITYISRQGRSRALDPDSHDSLVTALKNLETTHGYELNIVVMEELTKLEQIWLAARTTIMIGVHGNGLTSLLWMQPSPFATVIEISYPNGFASDYQVPARDLGIQYYGVWNDHYFHGQSKQKPTRHQPEGFHGNQIPVDGPTVAQLCVQRLTKPGLRRSKMDGVKQDLNT